VAVSLAEVRGHAKSLPQNESVLEACGDAAVTVAGADCTDQDLIRVRALLSALTDRIARVHEQIVTSYFSPTRPVEMPARDETDDAERLGTLSTGRPVAAVKIMSVREERLFQVTHVTTYDYDGPVDHSYNEAHLCPRDTECQRRLSHAVEIDPAPASQSQYRDPFGNNVITFGVTGGFTRLTVTARSKVVVLSRQVPQDGMPWDSVRALLDADRRSVGRDARRHRAASRLVPTSEVFAEYAMSSFRARRPLVDAARDLSSRIHRDFVYEPGFTTVTTPLDAVFEHRRGVCQDFAHFMIACLRSLGLAARYVSGYIETRPPGESDSAVGASASHAWVSVYSPGWGWVDLDPTNDQLVGDSYVITAWGRDYWDVSPLRGSVEGGGGSHRLHVAVAVEPLAVLTERTDPAQNVAAVLHP
jgi:transglutaminase-like putative cysteine protease